MCMKPIRTYSIFLSAVCLAVLTLGCSISIGGSSEAEKHNDAGLNLLEQGLYEDAIAELDEAIRIDPQYAVAY